jgi:hypothetical protein
MGMAEGKAAGRSAQTKTPIPNANSGTQFK